MGSKLKVVTTRARTGLKPPRTLGGPGRALWDGVMAEYRVDDVGGIALLTAACESLDLAAKLREQVERDGPVIQAPSGPKEHPALRSELANRSYAMKCLRDLGITVEPAKAPGGQPIGGTKVWRMPAGPFDDGDDAA